MTDWIYPETWKVGDKLDDPTLNRRVRDQTSLLLRKPLLVATHSIDQAISATTNTSLSFDTIVQDDDGMAITASPYTSFTAQREGTYQVWFSGLVHGPGAFADLDTCLIVNGTVNNRRWDSQARIIDNAAVNFAHNLSGVVFLFAGDTVGINVWSTATVTFYATLGTPRFACMWLGIS
ncbi:MAG TPA: hypothetical protein VIV60_25670 [Polyangiaceae bacterium]